jgi:uncharacterized protein YggE
MKNLLSIAFLVTIAFGGELIINKSKTFSASDKPTKLSTRFSLSQSNANIAIIESNFAKNNALIKKSKICQGGGYNIRPLYDYANNKKEFIGYEGVVSYDCIFEDSSKYENLIKSILQDGQNITLGSISWILGDKQSYAIEQHLEQEVFKYASSYSAYLNSHTGKKCSATKIDFVSGDLPFPRAYQNETMLAKRAISLPTQEDQSISKTVQYEFLCK